MDYSTLLQALANKVGQNLDDSDKVIKDGVATQIDRIKQMNPSVYGPPTPDYTDADKKLAMRSLQPAMGALNNLAGGANAAEDAVRASDSLSDLTGKGTEYLVSPEGEVRARFLNGNLSTETPVGSDTPTIAPTDASGLLPKLASMLKKTPSDSQELLNAAGEEGSGASPDQIQAATDANSRSIDFKQRLADQLRARRGMK